MEFLIDENLPRSIAETTAEESFHAVWVGDVLHGRPDSEILDRLRQTEEILVTRDVRFANMVGAEMARAQDLSGVILIREQNLNTIYTIWESYLRAPGAVEGLVVLTARGVRRHRFR